MVVNRKSSLRCRDAADERQYMLSGDYEVYEKVGEPVGAVSFHYHDFYELIYIIEGEFSSLIEDRAVRMRKGDFLLIDKNVMHKYHPTEKKMDSSRRIILWISDAAGAGGGRAVSCRMLLGSGAETVSFPHLL